MAKKQSSEEANQFGLHNNQDTTPASGLSVSATCTGPNHMAKQPQGWTWIKNNTQPLLSHEDYETDIPLD